MTASGAAPSLSLADDLFGDELTDPNNVPTAAEEDALARVASPSGMVDDQQDEEEVGDDLFGDGGDDDE